MRAEGLLCCLVLVGLHVCEDILNVVELLELLNHLVDGLTLLGCDVLLVVGDVGELTADILEALLLEVLLYG